MLGEAFGNFFLDIAEVRFTFRTPTVEVGADNSDRSAAMTVLALYEPYASAGGRFPVEWGFFIVWSILGLLFWKGAARVRHQLSEEERRDRILS